MGRLPGGWLASVAGAWGFGGDHWPLGSNLGRRDLSPYSFLRRWDAPDVHEEMGGVRVARHSGRHDGIPGFAVHKITKRFA